MQGFLLYICVMVALTRNGHESEIKTIKRDFKISLALVYKFLNYREELFIPGSWIKQTALNSMVLL